MKKYLDSVGLAYLWNKIKATFVSKDDDVVYMAEDDGEGGVAEGGDSLPANIIAEEDGLYQIKGADIYPVSHPDISTQPSVLPQRFGKEKIYEVLCPVDLDTATLNEGVNVSESLDYTTHEDFLNNPISNLEPVGVTSSPNNYMKIYYSSTYSSAYVGYSTSGGIAQFTDFPNFGYTPRIGLRFSNNAVIIPMGNPQENMSFFKYFTIVELDISDYPIISYGIYKIEDGQIISCTSEDLERLEGYGYTFAKSLVVDIPSTAIIIEASLFNSKACVPAICKKENDKWTITNNEGITPDFALVRYIEDMKDYYYENYYYENQSDSGPTIIKSFDIPLSGGSSVEWPTQMNVPEIWGKIPVFETGQIIGKVIVNSSSSSYEKFDLVVISVGNSLQVGAPSVDNTGILNLSLSLTAGSSPGVITAPPYDTHIDFYAL